MTGNAIVLDTETTDVSDDAEILECAWSNTMPSPKELTREVHCLRYGVTRPISLGAMSVHHIIPEDLEGSIPFGGENDKSQWLGEDVSYIIGHNVDFDWRMLGRPKVRRICTLAVARSLLPNIDSHSLGALVYHFASRREIARTMLKSAHSADGDVMMLLTIVLPSLLLMLPPVDTWEQLWLISEDARIPNVMSFGKHRGQKIADIPRDYKRWLLGQPDVDPYLQIALRRHS